MKKFLLITTIFILAFSLSYAQGPQGKDLGFGIQLGDPTAITMKKWINRENSFQISLGSGSFAGLRITGDYLWDFDAFNSRDFRLYAGPGAVIGLGRGNTVIYKQNDKKWYYREENGFGLGVRGIVGANYKARKAPIEIFLELGVLVGITPSVGALSESALGIRFYF